MQSCCGCMGKKVQHDGTANGVATRLSHLHPSRCGTALPAVVKDQDPNGTDFSRLPFPPSVEGSTLLATHCCLFPLSPCQHFKQLVDELQAKGVGTVNKALTESFKILREVRESVPMFASGASVPAHSYLPLYIPHGAAGGGWHELISWAPNL